MLFPAVEKRNAPVNVKPLGRGTVHTQGDLTF